MIVMKFGGSSLATGKHIQHVAGIIKNHKKDNDIVIVVSAMHKMTDKLILLFEKYKNGQFEEAFEDIKMLHKIHKQALNDLRLSVSQYRRVNNNLLKLFGELSIKLILHNDNKLFHYDSIITFGERFSCCLLAAALNKIGLSAKAIDASEVIVANSEFTNAKVSLINTKIKVEKFLRPVLVQKVIPVVTGFFGATKDGDVVTLGRGSSDYSATILAYVLNAKEVILWKEVDGIFSGDPKKDKELRFYPELSYEEALSLARNGAKILHSEAMKPVSKKGITVWVKNTFNPEFTGTKIHRG